MAEKPQLQPISTLDRLGFVPKSSNWLEEATENGFPANAGVEDAIRLDQFAAKQVDQLNSFGENLRQLSLVPAQERRQHPKFAEAQRFYSRLKNEQMMAEILAGELQKLRTEILGKMMVMKDGQPDVPLDKQGGILELLRMVADDLAKVVSDIPELKKQYEEIVPPSAEEKWQKIWAELTKPGLSPAEQIQLLLDANLQGLQAELTGKAPAQQAAPAAFAPSQTPPSTNDYFGGFPATAPAPKAQAEPIATPPQAESAAATNDNWEAFLKSWQTEPAGETVEVKPTPQPTETVGLPPLQKFDRPASGPITGRRSVYAQRPEDLANWLDGDDDQSTPEEENEEEAEPVEEIKSKGDQKAAFLSRVKQWFTDQKTSPETGKADRGLIGLLQDWRSDKQQQEPKAKAPVAPEPPKTKVEPVKPKVENGQARELQDKILNLLGVYEGDLDLYSANKTEADLFFEFLQNTKLESELTTSQIGRALVFVQTYIDRPVKLQEMYDLLNKRLSEVDEKSSDNEDELPPLVPFKKETATPPSKPEPVKKTEPPKGEQASNLEGIRQEIWKKFAPEDVAKYSQVSPMASLADLGLGLLDKPKKVSTLNPTQTNLIAHAINQAVKKQDQAQLETINRALLK